MTFVWSSPSNPELTQPCETRQPGVGDVGVRQCYSDWSLVKTLEIRQAGVAELVVLLKRQILELTQAFEIHQPGIGDFRSVEPTVVGADSTLGDGPTRHR